ncbi:MAG: glycosyltransferase family 2 protein [Nitrospinae bacterium]|nr:glycosyltransferase family 2 protein [Nitrospinota bacterium]
MNHLKRKQAERFTKQAVSIALLTGDPSTSSSAKGPLNGHHKTLIVIPSFNEEVSIGGVLEDIRKHAPGIPVVVIDDGSTDDTARIAEEHGAKVISLPYNSGYGVALQTGYIYALKNDYAIVVQMDADGQHDPACICDLLREAEKEDVDVVVGSRFLGQNSYRTSLARRTGMFIFGKLASLFCGTKISDPTSGFQAIKGKAIRFVAGDCYPPDYPDADFLIMLNRCGFKIREIPVKMHPSRVNKSMHGGPQSIYYVFKMFLSIFVTLLRKKPRI